MITKAVCNFQDASQSRKGEKEGEDWEEREEGKEAAQIWHQLRGGFYCDDGVKFFMKLIEDKGGEFNFTNHLVALDQLS